MLPFVALADAATTPDAWVVGIINNLLNRVVWPVFSGIVVIMFIYAGIKYFMAHGDPSKVQEANKAVIWAVVGVMVGLISFSLVSMVRFAFGL